MPAVKNKPVPSNQKVTDEQIIADVPSMGVHATARKHGVSPRAIFMRKARLEKYHGVKINPPTRGGDVQQLDRHQAVLSLGIENGEVLIGSDSHYWPGIVSTAHRAFVEFAKDRKPKVIIKNGDEMDFPALSRFAPIGWEKRPSVIDELENTKAMLSEIEKASPNSRRIWPPGNHDGRFETRLATVAPEFAKVKGVHLKDHFPNWEPCWAAFINKDVVVKHRHKGGVYAARNNTMYAGRTSITGHLHALKVWPHSDYNGTRWGVDCGTLADPYSPQFYNYTELNPLDWRSGFVLLTFVKGRLLWPETIWVSGPGTVQFRGKEWNV